MNNDCYRLRFDADGLPTATKGTRKPVDCQTLSELMVLAVRYQTRANLMWVHDGKERIFADVDEYGEIDSHDYPVRMGDYLILEGNWRLEASLPTLEAAQYFMQFSPVGETWILTQVGVSIEQSVPLS